jgi:hypothetical protein
MKKILAFALLTLCCLALVQQEACAWTNQRFSFGMEWQRQTGGNSFCGIWRNGQPPGADAFGAAPSYYQSTPAPHQGHASFGSFEYGAPVYAMPMQASPFQFATYAQPIFEYPSVYSGR